MQSVTKIAPKCVVPVDHCIVVKVVFELRILKSLLDHAQEVLVDQLQGLLCIQFGLGQVCKDCQKTVLDRPHLCQILFSLIGYISSTLVLVYTCFHDSSALHELQKSIVQVAGCWFDRGFDLMGLKKTIQVNTKCF